MILQSTDIRSELRRKRRRDALQCFGGLPWQGAIIAAASGAAAPWTPASLGSDLKLWLVPEASLVFENDLSSAEDTDPIRKLVAKDAGATEWVNTNTAAQPPWDDAYTNLNGKPALLCDQTGVLQHTGTITTTDGDWTQWACVYQTGNSNANYCMWWDGSTAGLGFGGSGVSSKPFYFDSAGVRAAPNNISTSNVVNIMVVRKVGTTYHVRCNGPANASAALTGAGTSTLINGRLILRPTIGGIVGAWGEYGVANALSDGQIDQLEAYLASRYGGTIA